MISSRDGSWTVAILTFLVAEVLYCGFIWLAFGDWARSGAFGDSFGALTSMFTGLAFVAIVLSQRSQQEEIRLANERHQLSIEAHKHATRALALGTMIRLWQERVASARAEGKSKLAEGWELEIERFMTELREISDGGSWSMLQASGDG